MGEDQQETESGTRRRSAAGPQTYVVQVRETLLDAGGDERAHWMDCATVTVPPRTKRETVIKQALTEAGQEAQAGLVLRVLDAENAEEVPVSWEQPPPVLVIGGGS